MLSFHPLLLKDNIVNREILEKLMNKAKMEPHKRYTDFQPNWQVTDSFLSYEPIQGTLNGHDTITL